jgi:hypothetical protein
MTDSARARLDELLDEVARKSLDGSLTRQGSDRSRNRTVGNTGADPPEGAQLRRLGRPQPLRRRT